MRDPVKIYFWSIKNSSGILDKPKARDFNANSLSTYAFSTLYHLIKIHFKSNGHSPSKIVIQPVESSYIIQIHQLD